MAVFVVGLLKVVKFIVLSRKFALFSTMWWNETIEELWYGMNGDKERAGSARLQITCKSGFSD